jgi:hypothetical protein
MTGVYIERTATGLEVGQPPSIDFVVGSDLVAGIKAVGRWILLTIDPSGELLALVRRFMHPSP